MSVTEELQWVVGMGDFALLRNLLLKRRHSFFWMLLRWIDALLRGFGQVVFANNPISGLLIMITLGLSVPGTLIAGAGTGFFGLLLSVMLRDTEDNIGNGLTIYNPLLIGTVSYDLVPNVYGDIDAFVVMFMIVGTVFSVYLTRSLATGRFPCITVPFNVVELILLLILTMQRDFAEFAKTPEAFGSADFELFVGSGSNTTSPEPLDSIGTINKTFTTDTLDWGLVFRGVVTSASQVYGADDVAVGSVIYLGILIYSPTSALFALLGALSGTLIALGLSVPYVSVYAGIWGFNSLLTAVAFGGLFIVISGQTSAAAFVAIIFTTLLQYVATPIMAKIGLPVLTVPFVTTAWLFFGLRDSVDGSFPRPTSITFPEYELHKFRSKRRDLKLYSVEDESDPENPVTAATKPSDD